MNNPKGRRACPPHAWRLSGRKDLSDRAGIKLSRICDGCRLEQHADISYATIQGLPPSMLQFADAAWDAAAPEPEPPPWYSQYA